MHNENAAWQQYNYDHIKKLLLPIHQKLLRHISSGNIEFAFQPLAKDTIVTGEATPCFEVLCNKLRLA